MSFRSILVGVLLLLPGSVSAQAISQHAQSRLTALIAARGAVSITASTPCPDYELELHALRELRFLFHDVSLALRGASRDLLDRSACAAFDIALIEQEIEQGITKLINAATSCDVASERRMVQLVASGASLLRDVRLGGLDPDYGRPPGPVPTSPAPTAADAVRLCPYKESYAVPTLQDFFTELTPQKGKGCRLSLLPAAPPPGTGPIYDEAKLLDRIFQRLLSYAPTAPGVQQSLLGSAWQFWLSTAGIRDVAWVFHTTNLTVSRPSLPPLTFPGGPPPKYGNAVNTIGEAGCRDWPSPLPSGIVVGRDFPLAPRVHSPFLSPSLTRIASYLEVVGDRQKTPNEYLEDLRRRVGTGSLIIGSLGRELLEPLYQAHLEEEAGLTLSIIDVQDRLRGPARALLTSTRRFAHLSSVLPGDPPGTVPSLRRFAGSLLTFLSQMCVNRGCSVNLRRTLELSLRDECFPFYTYDQYLRSGTPLPPCASRYVPP